MSDLIALRHIGVLGTRAISVALMPEEKAVELLSKAESGDTLHRIPDEYRADMYLIWGEIERQLTGAEYVTVP